MADGAARPAVGSVTELVRALTGARSVAYSRTGASGIYFARLLRELGIGDEVDTRATVVERGFTAEALLDGRAALAVQQISELHTVGGVDVVGPLPEPVQHYTEFSPDRPDALEMALFLASDAVGAVYSRYGLERLPARR